jgi:hypothetical protein
MSQLHDRTVGSADPLLNDTPPFAIPAADASIRIKMPSAWALTPYPLLDSHVVHQLDTDTYWAWNNTTLAWTQIGGPTVATAYTTISTDGGTIVSGITNIAVEADSTHTIDAVATMTTMKIFNSKGYNATINPPSGWSFSTGEESLVLGWWSCVNLSYYVDQVIIVESISTGVEL